MFTGLIQGLGRLTNVEWRERDARFQVEAPSLPTEEIALGESIAVNGVCLTVVQRSLRGFMTDVSAETLRCTTLGSLEPGTRINLERCLTLSSLLGGHLVTGHVDGVGSLLDRHPDGVSEIMRFEAPEALVRYIAPKGSIAIDGTSLTVNSVSGNQFTVNIVPHTLEYTVVGDYRSGQRVNLEADLLARYLERLSQGSRAP